MSRIASSYESHGPFSMLEVSIIYMAVRVLNGIHMAL